MSSSSKSNFLSDYGFYILSAIMAIIVINAIKDKLSSFFKKASEKGEPSEASYQKILPIEVPIVMSLEDLNKMTDNFGGKALISEGSYGNVFVAKLSNSQKVVVKKLDTSSSSAESDSYFAAQLSVVSALKHENFVTLMGYCLEANNRILVYEFATMGTLHDVLHGAESGPVLTWDQRAKIAVGAARGLEYLHEKVQPPITHRDFRSSNVLLFDDFTAKVADFNLTDQSSDTTDPEDDMTEKITRKTDVYNFGVVLLELLTGRKPIDNTLPDDQQNLVTWATPLLSDDKVNQCVDPKLNNEYPAKAIAKVAALVGLCVQDEPDFRPNMTIMVRALQPLINEYPA